MCAGASLSTLLYRNSRSTDVLYSGDGDGDGDKDGDGNGDKDGDGNGDDVGIGESDGGDVDGDGDGDAYIAFSTSTLCRTANCKMPVNSIE